MRPWRAAMVVARQRLLGARILVGFLVTALLILLMAGVERESPVVSHELVLRGMTVGLAMPLWGYLIVARVAGSEPLWTRFGPLGRSGLDRRQTVAWLTLTLEFTGAGVGALFSLLAVLGAGAGQTPGGAASLGNVLWVGATGGASYVALVSWGATVGTKGKAKVVVLLLDGLLGAGTSALAVVWPRAHLRQLLGGEAVLSLPTWGSCVVLMVLIVVATCWTAARTPR